MSADGVLARELGLLDSIAIIVGTIIGSAIFLIPNTIAFQLPSLQSVLVIWVAGGVLSLFGAISLAELGSVFPRSGGLYFYLRQLYGRPIGFLYGWALLLMIHSGSIAALSVAFSVLVSQFLPLGVVGQRILGVTFVLGFTLINCLGIYAGKIVQNLLAATKVAGLAAMILLLQSFSSSANLLTTNLWNQSAEALSWKAVGAALVAVLWAYEGWHVVSFASGEMKDPKRDLPRSLVYGMLIVLTVYILANITYYTMLTHAEISQSNQVAASAMSRGLGPTATVSILVLIILSILGAMNGMILTGPRVYYAMACDGIFFSAFARLHPRSKAPVNAILVQGIWTSLLIFMGNYQQLFTSVIFIAWLFYGLSVAGVIVLRYTQPELPRPFKVWGFPLVPVMFCIAAVGILVSAIVAEPKHGLVAGALLLAGLPVYAFFLQPAKGLTAKPETPGLGS